jgi:hypothetical protein
MSPNTSQSSDRDSLQKQLDEAESELRQRLEDACESEAKGVSNESTEEVRRLEDNLLAAAVAAKQTITLRGQMKSRKHTEREPRVQPDDKPAMGVREFTDAVGRPWRAWSVVPGTSRASSHGGQILGDFQSGSPARRRLPFPQSKWLALSDEELKQLLQQAIDAPVRERRSQRTG